MYSLKIIVSKLGADSAAIMLPDVTNKTLFCYDSYNMPQDWIEIKNTFDEKIVGGNVEVYFSGEPATTNQLCKFLEGYYVESVLIVPIKQGKEVLGTLEIIHSTKNMKFSREDLQDASTYSKDILNHISKPNV